MASEFDAFSHQKAPVLLEIRRFLRSAAIVARRQLHVSYPAPIQRLYRDSIPQNRERPLTPDELKAIIMAEASAIDQAEGGKNT